MHRLACLPLTCLLACAAEPPPLVRMNVPEDGSAPRYGETPFPSDAWRGPDGHLEPLPGIEEIFARDGDLVASHLAALDGFGLRPLVEFPLDRALDPDSVPALTRGPSDPIAVVDVDPRSPERGRILAYEWRYDPDALVLRGSPRPGTVLREGTTYAAVLTAGVLDAGGRPLRRAPALDRLSTRPVPRRWRSTAAALAALDESPEWIGGQRIVAAATFTTQRASRALLAARARLGHPSQIPPPELSFDDSLVFAGRDRLDDLFGVATRFESGPRAGQERWGFSNPTGVAHDHVGVVATGRMTDARFRRPDTGDDSPEDETFEINPTTGAPILQAIDSIPVTFVLPAAPAPSPAGYPVAIIGHGLGSSRHAILAFAEPLTRAGYALVAIDFDGHGSRASDRDSSNNLARIIDDFSGDADMPDGFGDKTGLTTTFEVLEQLRNFSGARDSIRQSVLDVSQLILLLEQKDLDLSPLAIAYGGEAPRLDTRRIAYLGESYGTIIGGVLAGIEPDVDLYVHDVPGAGIIDLAIVNSPALATLLLPLGSAMYGLDGRLDRFHPAVSLLQSLVDAADPLTYAPHVLRDHFEVDGRPLGPRHVVAIEVVGDEVLHNRATNAWARALGLAVLRPDATAPPGLPEIRSPASANAGGQTAVLVQYQPATHGANWSSERGRVRFQPGFPHPGPDPFPLLAEPIEIENPIYATWDQVVEVLDTHRDGAPKVESTLPPERSAPWN